MDKKQKEALVIAMLEKGEPYRDIAQKAKVSPNTIKAISNRAGLDETTSISSRAFELYVQQRTPVQVAIALNLEAEKAINYYHQYFMLLGITEFTKAYLQVKENPWPFVDLAKLVQNAKVGEGEVMELLKIANGYLPRVRLEYDRLKEEKSSLEAELNSWKVEISNSVRIYQGFCDRNLELKKRENELQHSINELEGKMTKLQMADNDNANLEIKQGEVILMDDVFIPPLNMVIDHHEYETLHYPPQVKPSPRTLIFDTKDSLPTKAQT
jgi:DNA repair exonuclease SbcCD ATPase subunit